MDYTGGAVARAGLLSISGVAFSKRRQALTAAPNPFARLLAGWRTDVTGQI
jgi:hypothetical protein